MNHRTIKIGRSSDNDIVLSHKSISRHHLDVFIDSEGNVFITDNDSSNGTFVNGNRVVGSVKLNKGDILKLGADKPLQWQEWVFNNAVSMPEIPLFAQQKKSGRSEITTIILGIIIFVLIIFITFYSIKKMKGEKSEPAVENNETIKTDDSTTTVLQKEPNAPASPNDSSTTIQPSDPSNKTTATVPTNTTTSYPTTNKSTHSNGDITYDFSCLSDPNDNNQTSILNEGSDVNDLVLDAFGDPVSINDEKDYGNKLFDDIKQKYNIIYSGSGYDRLQGLLSQLVLFIPNPRGFDYELFFLESDELNAFTAGGKIYVTTEMYNFCKSDDELACIIGHEIYHNELGHIKYGIKMASIPGSAIISLITTSFNQKKETACDMHGIDLAISAGFSGCSCVSVWKRMSTTVDNHQYDPLDNLFRSHPYSAKREACARNHIQTNYNYTCY